ncbi:hypothetical protein RB608_12540 [Nocardioides sp. LHD-245]|uniref:hypothetical protein n=1 Tax=Nocardioides sp. LHD-245 TaxID=3051387 RepID=UPI0027E192DE|nr:hypothetical protein [Nocardioides sp. LHD-245]
MLPYVSIKTYWALGGSAGLPSGFDMALEFEKNGAPDLLVWMERHSIDFTVVLALAGVALLAMLTGRRSPRVPRLLLLIPAWMGAIFLVPYGLLTAITAASGGAGEQGQVTGWLTVAAVLTFCGLGTCLGICALSGHVIKSQEPFRRGTRRFRA